MPEERLAIDEGLKSIERGEGIPAEKVLKEFKLDNYDRDAAGKEDFLDAISRVQVPRQLKPPALLSDASIRYRCR